MAAYSVFEPPSSDLDAEDHAARFVFLRDGFSWGAFFFGALWMLWHRLWLPLFLYIVGMTGLAFVADLLRLSDPAQLAILLAIALLIGLEAPTLRRWKFRKWQDRGIVVADDVQMAERRFFDNWFERRAAPPVAQEHASPQVYPRYAIAPTAMTHASPGIIGSFPEAGGPR